MIRYLRIHRLAVIDHLELELGPGMSVLTGETGAGKSIVVEALNLLLGGRASADLVRTGEETATVQAIIEDASGRELIVRREISAQGRSRAFLDDELVTTATLRNAVGDLIDLHGQHEHQALLAPAIQLALLDRFAGLDDLRSEVASAWTAFVEARDRLASFEALERDRAARLDLLEFQRHEIDKVAPVAGEDETLAAERQVVANAERLGRLSAESYAALYDDDQAVLSRLAFVWKRVAELAELDPRFLPFLETRDAVHAPLDELARFLRDYAGSLDSSPDRLQAIEDRLAALERLKRRYGPTLDEVIARRKAIGEELAALDPASDHAANLRRAAAAAETDYRTVAGKLSTARHKAAATLARALERSLADLAMAGTRCELRLSTASDPSGWSASGIDQVELFISPNVGEELRPLSRIASGGELSRVMLAMKTLASTDAPGKTLIFDEVDAGIGGGVADVVGARLHALSTRAQVLCITHLPQVAAYGDHHYRVSKAVSGDRTVTRVERLSPEARVDELARMMGGVSLSDAVRAGARDLLASREGRKANSQAKAKGETRRTARLRPPVDTL